MHRENKYIQSIFSDNLAFKPGMNVNILYILYKIYNIYLSLTTDRSVNCH